MVLGGQPPGRVGRRRSSSEPPRGAALFMRRCRLGGEALLRAGPVVQMVRRSRGEGDRAPFAVPGGLGLDPVLAERREVDHEVSGVQEPLAYVDQLSHGRQARGGPGRNRVICRETCVCVGWPAAGAYRPRRPKLWGAGSEAASSAIAASRTPSKPRFERPTVEYPASAGSR